MIDYPVDEGLSCNIYPSELPNCYSTEVASIQIWIIKFTGVKSSTGFSDVLNNWS